MGDLIAGTLILLAVSAGLFFGGLAVARRCPAACSAAVGAAGAVFIVVFGLGVHGTLLVAQVVPFSGALVLGNWIPPAAALLAGVLVGRRGLPRWRRGLFALLLLAAAWYTVACNFLRLPPPARDRWARQRVCLQSTAASCSPCAAATLLRHYGIETGEREMINLCLTRRQGTPSLGLYRGLKLKARASGWDVEVVRCSVEDLCGELSEPVLLRFRLPEEAGAAPEFLERWGWAPDAGHAVVLYRICADGRAETGDPAVGIHKITPEALQARWRGEGLRLVRRRLADRQADRDHIDPVPGNGR